MTYKIEQINMKDHLTSLKVFDAPLLFHKSILGDGCILAWYSQNPCGNCTDGDKGWMVIDRKKKEIVDEYETMYMHMSCGEGFIEWKKNVLKEHGKGKIIRNEWGGQLHVMGE